MIKRIQQFHEAKSDAISFVLVSDCSGISTTLHAFAITVTKINGETSYIFSEDGNRTQYEGEIEYIQNLMENYKKIEKFYNAYQETLYSVNSATTNPFKLLHAKKILTLGSYGLNVTFLIFLCWHLLPEQYKTEIKT